MRIVDLIERNAVLYRDEPAVHVLGGTSVTHGELAQRARGLAAGLAARGVRRGDRIALLAGNGLVYFDVYLAAAYLGAAAVPLSTRASTSELQFMIDDAEPSLIVVDDANGGGSRGGGAVAARGGVRRGRVRGPAARAMCRATSTDAATRRTSPCRCTPAAPPAGRRACA